MTETDRVYIAVVETMKKHGVEQAMGALKKYVTEGNCGYFTSTNGARQAISEIHPLDIMQDALRSTSKTLRISSVAAFAAKISKANPGQA